MNIGKGVVITKPVPGRGDLHEVPKLVVIFYWVVKTVWCTKSCSCLKMDKKKRKEKNSNKSKTKQKTKVNVRPKSTSCF